MRLDDAFFMPLLFLLSGLFVWEGLARRGAGAFLRARMRRLGLPFVLAVLTLVPLAYYPSFLQAGGAPGFGAYWSRTVTVGPWPSGPPWFIGVLLLVSLVRRPVVLAAAWPRRAWMRTGTKIANPHLRLARRPDVGGERKDCFGLPMRSSQTRNGGRVWGTDLLHTKRHRPDEAQKGVTQSAQLTVATADKALLGATSGAADAS